MGEGGFTIEESVGVVGRVADPGDYERHMDASCFKDSRVMRTAAGYIESGKFEEGLQVTLDGIKRRGIQLDFVPRQQMIRGTKVTNGAEAMILPEGFENQHPAKKLWSLLHRNMSLILQRMGKREDLQFMKQLLEMDVAYAQSLRLGATTLPQDERKKVEDLADDLDSNSRYKMAYALARPAPLE